MAEVRKVAVISGQMPKCCSENRGVHCVPVTNSHSDTIWKKWNVSFASERMIPAVVSAPTVAAAKRMPPIRRSRRSRARFR